MPLDEKFLYEPRTMMEALRQNPAPRRFLMDTFFRRAMTFNTASVDLDIQKTKRRMASFTAPDHAGKVVEREGYYTVTVKPAYIKERVPTRVADLLHRQMSETIYDPISPMERAAELMGQDLRMLDERITRREEQMCAEALFTGKIVISGDGLNDVVDFQYAMGEHLIVLSGGDGWNQSTGKPLRDLDEWKIEIIRRCGVAPTHAICGTDVYWAIINNPDIMEKLDNRRVELGSIKPSDLPNGVRYLGTLLPAMIDLYAYDEWYTDPVDGMDKPLVPADSILLGSNQAYCTMNYGLIQNLNSLAAVSRFPFTWQEEDGSARWLQMESAPLPNLAQADAFLVAKVIS